MNDYSSLTRRRSSQFQEDWRRVDQWRDAIQSDRDAVWSVLVEISTGDVVAKWDRRHGVEWIETEGRY